MISGRLSDRVEIWGFVTEPDEIGYPVETWKKMAEVWGTLTEERGSEILKNDRPMEIKSAQLFIRYRSDVTVKNKIKTGGILWDIENVREVSNSRRKEGLDLVLRFHG